MPLSRRRVARCLKSFVNPLKAYRLEFPAHWEHRVKEGGRSCGFGPYERDNVGLWISILPFHTDTDRLWADLPALTQQMLASAPVTNTRQDATLKHRALKADITTEGQGGHYWLVVGGDLVLMASSQVPGDERDIWNGLFDQLMASLQITRAREHLHCKVADEVLQRLHVVRPEQDYRFDDQKIRGRDHVVFLDNIVREVLENPDRREELVQKFVEGVTSSVQPDLGWEEWPDIQGRVLPVLKPISYIKEDSPTKHVFVTDWLPEVVICYVINGEKSFRFITGWDLNRWGVEEEQLRETAVGNLRNLPWPRILEGSRQPDGDGRVILVCTPDSF